MESKFDINLIIVDWGAGANTVNYIAARRRVEEVGKYLAQLIDTLNRELDLDFKTTHLIGHSLGAHCSGFGKDTKLSVFFLYLKTSGEHAFDRSLVYWF